MHLCKTMSDLCDLYCVYLCVSPGDSSGDGRLHRRRHLQRFARCRFQEEGFHLHPTGTHSATSFPVHVSEGQHARRTPQGEPVSRHPSFLRCELMFSFNEQVVLKVKVSPKNQNLHQPFEESICGRLNVAQFSN